MCMGCRDVFPPFVKAWMAFAARPDCICCMFQKQTLC